MWSIPPPRKRMPGLEEPGTGEVMSLNLFSLFMRVCVVESGVLHILKSQLFGC